MEEWLLGSAGSPWALPLLWLLVVGDGVIPAVPSEVFLISLASLAVQGEGVPLAGLAAGAFFGAFVGENIAYSIGALIPIDRMKYFNDGSGHRRVKMVRDRLRTHGSAYILAARFIPGVRVVVNISVGAAGFPRSRFMGLAAATSALWTAYMIAMGAGAGHLFSGQPLLSVVVGIVAGTAIGMVLDRVLSRRTGSE
ncbi:MAG: DedA family protein [Ancrocorticia populi]|uniref:DedA family protein n=1 Tax=Ancrocorticia populi TaxID=2175228 RepID=UPI003F901EF2